MTNEYMDFNKSVITKIPSNQCLYTMAGVSMLIGVSIFAYNYLACRKKELDIEKESELITSSGLGSLA